MTLNASARRVQIFISGKDFSPCFLGLTGSDNHLDQSGLISFTGTITLGPSLGFDESLDDRKNPRLQRGAPIIINIINSANTWARHPRGKLRILSSKYEEATGKITLEVGDLISLLNFKEPTDPDDADNKSPENQSAASIITKLLNLAGINAIAGNLPNTIYNYPLNLSGSYLGTVGKLLYANNCFGWIDKDEVFQVRSANIAASGTAIYMQIGSDEIWYRRLEGAEAPCEIVKALGSETIVRPFAEYLEYTSEEYGAASTVDKAYGNFKIVIKQVRRVQRWNSDQKILTTETYTAQPYGLVVPKVFWGVLPPLLRLIDSEITIETLAYESARDGKLKSSESKTYRLRASYLAEYKSAKPNAIVSSLYTFNLIRSELKTYSYDAKDRPQKITTYTLELAIAILNGTGEDWVSWQSPPEYLVPAKSSTEQWQELSKDNWEHTLSTLACVVRVDSNLVKFAQNSKIDSNKLDLISSSGEGFRRVSNAGQENPPAVEHRPADFTYENRQLEQKIVFGSGSDLKPRERSFSVDFLCGRLEPSLRPGEVVMGGGGSMALNQLMAIAMREGRLLRGRYQGQEIALTMVDEIFNYHPLMTIRATEQDGIEQVYLADGTSWVISPRRALVASDGIWVGTAANGQIIPPYVEQHFAEIGWGWGCEIKCYPYQLTKTPITVNAGLGMGLGKQIVPMLGGWGHGSDIVPEAQYPTIKDLITTAVGIGFGDNLRVKPSNFSPTLVTPLGSAGMAMLHNSTADDAHLNLPDIGFDFPFYDGVYRSDIYVGSNSYITFGFGSNNYNGLSKTNPGRGILIAATDRSYQRVYFQQSAHSCRIRYEGSLSTAGTPGSPSLAWEVTLFDDGAIMIVPDLIPDSPLSGIRIVTKGDNIKYTDFPYSFLSPDLHSLVFQYDGLTDNYTMQEGSYSINS